jgi:hypothetical protein
LQLDCDLRGVGFMESSFYVKILTGASFYIFITQQTWAKCFPSGKYVIRQRHPITPGALNR